jgi:hypothetical protein
MFLKTFFVAPIALAIVVHALELFIIYDLVIEPHKLTNVGANVKNHY